MSFAVLPLKKSEAYNHLPTKRTAVCEMEEIFNLIAQQEAQNVHFPPPEEDYAVIERENGFAGTLKRRRFHMYGKGGFTLVELMVVTAIVGILAAVATPAYINYVNRSKQGEAASMLFTARLEMEEFYTDNGHYASTIKCLPSFGNTCSGAGSATVHNYIFSVPAAPTTLYYQVLAQRKIYSYAASDKLTISATTDTPVIQNTDALKFSVFQWLFQ
jgi:prepilin-type N-terminal cleavage/methylation domain-containing protein